MRSRILVAAAGIPLVYLITFVPWQQNLVFALFLMAVSAGATLEFYDMFKKYRPWVPAGLVTAALVPLLTWKASEPGIFAGMLLLIPMTLIFASLSVSRENPSGSLLATLAGVAYVVPPIGLILIVRGTPHGFALLWMLLLSIWANDAVAYFAGRAFGKHKLSPRISPNKTVEGFVAGVCAGTLVTWWSHFVIKQGDGYWMTGWEALILGLALAVAAPVGDLFESMLKRSNDVKDSSHLLGEHGGLLDRLDALIVATPVLYVGAFLIGLA